MNSINIVHDQKMKQTSCFTTAILLLSIFCQANSFGPSNLLSVRLCHKPTGKLLIVNCDDAGMCNSANMAMADGMENGLITSLICLIG